MEEVARRKWSIFLSRSDLRMNERRAEKDGEQEISKNQDLARSQKNKDLRSSPQYFTLNCNKIIKDIYALNKG